MPCQLILGAVPAELASSLQILRTVGAEGRDNAKATQAWKNISSASAEAIPTILEGMDGANELGLNWLRGAVDTIATRSTAQHKPLPLDALQTFLRNRQHHPRARRLAYELIASSRPEAVAGLLDGMLDDPAPELRRDAVDRLITQVAALSKTGQTNEANRQLQSALAAARDVDQIESISKSLREAGKKVDLPALFGWLTQWKVIGPFDNSTNAGFDRVYPPEEKIDLAAEYDGKTGKVRWQDLVTTNDYGLVDLNKPCGALKSVAGYAYTIFHAQRSGPVELRLGSKNGWKIWLNGKFIFGRDEYHRGAEIDQYRLPVQVQSGRNTILVKLTQNEMVEDWTKEWEFQLRVTDTPGNPIRSSQPAFP